MELATLTGLAFVAFVSTNIDDIFVLLGFYADPDYRARDVVAGQFVGIFTLFAISAIVSLVSLVIPAEYLRLLGIAPIFIGLKKLYDLWRGHETIETQLESHPRGKRGLLAVASVTIANGGDNIGIYAPIFAAKPAYALAVFGVVFALMTALWCAVGYWLVQHRTLGAPIRRYGHRIMPLVLIAIGGMILFHRNGA